MSSNKHLKYQTSDELKSLFASSVEIVLKYIGENAFKPKRNLNAAIFDAIMVGIAYRIEKEPILDKNLFQKSYQTLLNNSHFMLACETGTSDEENVFRRLSDAITEFDKVK
jgi:hypothetical protein